MVVVVLRGTSITNVMAIHIRRHFNEHRGAAGGRSTNCYARGDTTPDAVAKLVPCGLAASLPYFLERTSHCRLDVCLPSGTRLEVRKLVLHTLVEHSKLSCIKESSPVWTHSRTLSSSHQRPRQYPAWKEHLLSRTAKPTRTPTDSVTPHSAIWAVRQWRAIRPGHCQRAPLKSY
jgi:hypothetical protein